MVLFAKNGQSGLRQCWVFRGGGEGTRLGGNEKLGLHPIEYPQSRSVTSEAEGGRLFCASCSSAGRFPHAAALLPLRGGTQAAELVRFWVCLTLPALPETEWK